MFGASASLPVKLATVLSSVLAAQLKFTPFILHPSSFLSSFRSSLESSASR
jgi:hypothetical protein